MAKVTNFLSIALLVSVLAVSPVFAAGEPAAGGAGAAAPVSFATRVNNVLDFVGTPFHTLEDLAATPAKPAVEAQPEVVAQPARDAVLNDDNSVLVPAQPAVEARPAIPAQPAVAAVPSVTFRFAKYLTVIGLIVSNSVVQAAASSVVSAIQNACGGSAEEETESEEPTRLTIGRQA